MDLSSESLILRGFRFQLLAVLTSVLKLAQRPTTWLVAGSRIPGLGCPAKAAGVQSERNVFLCALFGRPKTGVIWVARCFFPELVPLVSALGGLKGS